MPVWPALARRRSRARQGGWRLPKPLFRSLRVLEGLQNGPELRHIESMIPLDILRVFLGLLCLFFAHFLGPRVRAACARAASHPGKLYGWVVRTLVTVFALFCTAAGSIASRSPPWRWPPRPWQPESGTNPAPGAKKTLTSQNLRPVAQVLAGSYRSARVSRQAAHFDKGNSHRSVVTTSTGRPFKRVG